MHLFQLINILLNYVKYNILGEIHILKTALCAVNTLVIIIVLFNIPEFFFYRAIYKFEMR